MYIAYYDESGDDGYPKYSSPLFVLSACCVQCLRWKDVFRDIRELREDLKGRFGLPVSLEFHTKPFILDKRPYRQLAISVRDRIEAVGLFCELVGRLQIRIVNVVINKKRIRSGPYGVLDKALSYSIQRIENDLERIDPSERFMIIADQGREGKMRKTTRRIQRFNFIPSKFSPQPYRKEIKLLIEDPFYRRSSESYLIQMSDLVAYIVSLHKTMEYGLGGLHNRLPTEVDQQKVRHWMDSLKPSLNLEASRSDEYGVVCYPK